MEESLVWTPEVIWYTVIVLVLIGYAALDGFDLGVGILHFFTKEDYERRIFMNAIGPVWDGNAVWLVVFVGGLFAGFPGAYATLLSAFYTPLTVLIAGLIFRAVAIEFRSKSSSTVWRKIWDLIFSVASFLIAIGIGVALGNLISGIALDENQNYIGDSWSFFTPYTLLIGVTTLACFAMHGAIFLLMKTEGEIHSKVRGWINPTIILFIICYAIATMATLIYQPHMVAHIQNRPILFLVVIGSILAIANIPREIHKGRDAMAFLSSCFNIAFLLALYGIGNFPTLVRSSVDPANKSITVFNAGASHFTLDVLLIIVAIGIPLVLIYIFVVYRVFRGKVKIDSMSY